MSVDIEKILQDNQVLKTGHFLLSSGLHSDKYFEKFRILENPNLVQIFCQMITNHFYNKDITIVCGPTTGGIIIAYEVARQMGIGVIVDRCGLVTKTKDFFLLDTEVDYFACYQKVIENFPPEKCPLCAAKVPLEIPGRSGK
ncbi:MAG: hypothetical protein ABIK19_03610 [candidate division WOR-3 bacterium]